MRDEKQAYVAISRKQFTCAKQNVSKTKSHASLTNKYVSTVVLKALLPQTDRHPSNQNRAFCAGKGQNLGWYGHWGGGRIWDVIFQFEATSSCKFW